MSVPADAFRLHRNLCIFCVDYDEKVGGELRCRFGGERLLALAKQAAPAVQQSPSLFPAVTRRLSTIKMVVISATLGFIFGLLLFGRW